LRRKVAIRFWRDGEATQFEVLDGDPVVVERCELKSKMAWLPNVS